MPPLPGLKGFWDSTNKVVWFEWDCHSIGNERYLYIIPVDTQDAQLNGKFVLVDMQRDPCGNTGRYKIELSTLNDKLKEVSFAVFAEQETLGRPELSEAARNNQSLIKVLIGHSTVYYAVKNRKKGKYQSVVLRIKADNEVPSGIIQYNYDFQGRPISQIFPYSIKQKVTQTPAIVIPKSSSISLNVIHNEYRGAIEFKRKAFLF